MNLTPIRRREFLQQASMASALLLTGTLDTRADEAHYGRASKDFVPDMEISLRATFDHIPILEGAPTEVWSYQSELLKGEPGNLQQIEGSYLGPVIRVQKGQKIRIHFTNEIPEPSIIHWHGLHVPESADGHPRFVIPQGKTYVYEFEINNRAGTYWFHPHPHGRTGPQVYFGLAGLFLITDEEEQAAVLPSGEYDIPVVIQDRRFDTENQLVYMTHMMERMMGFTGDQILINGKVDASFSVATRAYRFRLLNCSNSRIYKLAWSDNTPLTVIGTDGGLLERPAQRDYLMLAPAERVDLWVDFSNRPLGTELVLKSLPVPDMTMHGRMGRGMMGMGRGRGRMMMGAGSAEEDLTLFKVRVERKETEKLVLPERLSKIQRNTPNEAINQNKPRKFRFEMQHMSATINGRDYEMEAVAEDEVVKLNTTEVWQFVNAGGVDPMPHPVHVHEVQFQILERNWLDAPPEGWEEMKDGFVDEGLKDTVLLLPGMTAKVLMRFEDYPGLFLYHCHNLEHEDLGMMRNFRIEA